MNFLRWLGATVALGVAFLAGQLVVWRELAARGVYLATNPSSSFFYVLTAAHGVHLLGGVLALGYVVIQPAAWRVDASAAPRSMSPRSTGTLWTRSGFTFSSC